jgi:hypothetical protein
VKRFRRWLFNTVAALSLLLLLATATLWTWDSNKGNPTIWKKLLEIQTHSAYYRIGVDAMNVAISRVRPWPPVWEPQNWGEFNPQIEFPGFQARWASSGPMGRGLPESSWFIAQVHFMWITAATALFPIWWGIQKIGLRRHRPKGCCRTCGYDLRATPVRCPECGTIPEKAK